MREGSAFHKFQAQLYKVVGFRSSEREKKIAPNMTSGGGDSVRAASWLQSLAGSSASVREARRLRMETLCSVTEKQAALADSVQQIDKDLLRLAVRESFW